jgi:hypothetical protein
MKTDGRNGKKRLKVEHFRHTPPAGMPRPESGAESAETGH